MAKKSKKAKRGTPARKKNGMTKATPAKKKKKPAPKPAPAPVAPSPPLWEGSGSDNPFPLSEMMTQGFEQTRKAMESYLDFVEKNVKAAPRLDTDLTKKMKTFTEQNIATASEFAQKASNAKDFQDFWRTQTEFMQAQWKAFTDQTKELTESATKSATNVMKGPSS